MVTTVELRAMESKASDARRVAAALETSVMRSEERHQPLSLADRVSQRIAFELRAAADGMRGPKSDPHLMLAGYEELLAWSEVARSYTPPAAPTPRSSASATALTGKTRPGMGDPEVSSMREPTLIGLDFEEDEITVLRAVDSA